MEEIESLQKANDIAVTIFDGVTSTPKDFDGKAGAEVYIQAGCDGIL